MWDESLSVQEKDLHALDDVLRGPSQNRRRSALRGVPVIMLEPLIVLTVLNCFFMFSSTVTTCALWWQYRSHRCCFKKDSMQHAAKHGQMKLKEGSAFKNTKKLNNLKHDNLSSVSHSKSNLALSRESRSRKSSKQKRTSSLKSSINDKFSSDGRLSSIGTIGQWDFDNRTRISEASQTSKEPKSAVVMEYSTVQKIVQILDEDTDVSATKLVMRDINPRSYIEQKKTDCCVETNFNRPSITSTTTMSQT